MEFLCPVFLENTKYEPVPASRTNSKACSSVLARPTHSRCLFLTAKTSKGGTIRPHTSGITGASTGLPLPTRTMLASCMGGRRKTLIVTSMGMAVVALAQSNGRTRLAMGCYLVRQIIDRVQKRDATECFYFRSIVRQSF